MADRRSRRLAPRILVEDQRALDTLEALEDYTPANPAYTKEKAREVRTAGHAKQAKEVQDKAQANASRDAAVGGEWDVHEFVLGMGDQVAAQYGKDSNEYASFGFKKKSEYKSPKRKTPPQA